jgi:hypothetical protein
MPSYIGYDPAGVQAQMSKLEQAHMAVMEAHDNYRATAQGFNDVTSGSHFQSLNTQCEDLTNKIKADHTNLHTQYRTDTSKLVQGVEQVAGS